MALLALAFAVPAVSHADPCPKAAATATLQAPAPASAAQILDAALSERIEAVRASEGMGILETHAVLSEIAAAHARDMAERGYAADVTPEGLSLLDQVRLADRQSLFSTFGTNIAIAGADASADDLHSAVMSSENNAANIRRAGFSHIGVGSAEQDGRVYVVQLFAKIDGSLDQPLPVQAGMAPSLRTSLTGARMVPVSWSVSGQDGALLLRGSGERLRDGRGQPVEGYLNLDVAVGQDVYTLRGPFVRMN
ncbi:MAG: CAP domain-containing protein [Hyphomonas sp.]